jgi:diguanylate cyclase (GGDEF)-like protein
LREVIASHPLCYEKKDFRVTISLGVVTTEGDPSMTPTELIRLADEKLYQAKNSGRNCVAS